MVEAVQKASKKLVALGIAVAAAVVALDQLSKWLVLSQVAPPLQEGVEIAPFFNIVLVWNYGISFGMFAAHRQPVLLTLMSAVIVSILMIWLVKNTSALTAAALGCVIGGAVGNVMDRLRLGAVVDFLDFHIGAYHWPAFNVADSCIFIGVVLLCGGGMFTSRTNL